MLVTRCPVPQFLRMTGCLHLKGGPTNRKNKSFHSLHDRKSHSAQFVFLCSSVCECVCAYVCAYVRTCHPFYYLELQEGQCVDKSLHSGTRLGTLPKQRAPKIYLRVEIF